MPYHADIFKLVFVEIDLGGKFENEMYVCVFGVSCIYIDVLSISMRFSVVFCIYEHTRKHIVGLFRNFEFFKIPKTCFFVFFRSKKWS